MKYIWMPVFVFILGCSTLGRDVGRAPSGETLRERLRGPLNDSAGNDCQKNLLSLKDTFNNINWDAYSNEELNRDARAIIKDIWHARNQWHAQLGKLSARCAYSLREVFHQMRDVEDYLGEFAYHVVALNPATLKFQEQPVPLYNQQAYSEYFTSHSVDAKNFKFKAGDIMLARGISFISAIISQVSDNHSHFSHVVFVNVDPKTQKPNTIESYIGVGMANYEMEFALKNENARLLVLRPKNAELGVKAAAILTKMTLEGEKNGSPVPYDYAMDFKEHSRMSCAEVATASYQWASNGQIILPQYPAHITMNNDRFLSQLTLKRGETFTPDDLEIDPHFEVIADWRDTRLIRDSRYKDAILAEMMKWVGTLQYQFNDTWKSLFAKYFILPSRRTPLWGLVKKATGAPELDKEMPKKALGLMTTLAQLGDGLLENLEKADADYIAAHGRPMTNMQLREHLEAVRIQDRADYIERRRTLIHYALRPDDLRQKPAPVFRH